MAKTAISAKEWSNLGFKDFISETLSSPYALVPGYASSNQIQNRSLVANDLRPSMGLERIMFINAKESPKEFGPNGETIWELDTKDPRVRIGMWQNPNSYNTHSRVVLQEIGDFLEIVFYGTGLNILTGSDSSRDIRLTVDGGAESGSTVWPASISAVLQARNYRESLVLNIVSGLSLGWHIVKLRMGGVSDTEIYGCEIIGPTSLTFPAGSAFSGTQKDGLLANTVSSYTSSVTGTRGGRIVKYVKDGAISEAFQPVDASTVTYGSGVTHANEEIVRKVNFREFGANRSDDFTTLAGSDSTRAFALDDGTTNLICNTCHVSTNNGIDGLAGGSAGTSTITINFVGTGLDILRNDNSTTATHTVQIDGGGAISMSTTQRINQIDPIVSGLPYGTHTVRINKTGAGPDLSVVAFIIYQPKKPSIPAGAIELADYNVMGNFVANTTAGALTVSTGVLRKSVTREFIFIDGSGGTTSWADQGVLDQSVGGRAFVTDRTGSVQYTFFGTGFDFRFDASTNRSNNILCQLNGSTLNSTNFATASFSTYGTGVTFNSSTGILNQLTGSLQVGGFIASGLPLGVYTIKFTNQSAGNFIAADTIDIITPIHSHDKGFFKIGSLSLNDSRNKTPFPVNPTQGVDLTKAKAWLNYDGTSNKILSSFNIATVVNTGTGDFIVYFSRPFKNPYYISVTGSNMPEVPQYNYTSGANRTASYMRVQTTSSNGTLANSLNVYIVCFGELENEESQ